MDPLPHERRIVKLDTIRSGAGDVMTIGCQSAFVINPSGFSFAAPHRLLIEG